jgi:hypothetical protein
VLVSIAEPRAERATLEPQLSRAVLGLKIRLPKQGSNLVERQLLYLSNAFPTDA